MISEDMKKRMVITVDAGAKQRPCLFFNEKSRERLIIFPNPVKNKNHEKV